MKFLYILPILILLLPLEAKTLTQRVNDSIFPSAIFKIKNDFFVLPVELEELINDEALEGKYFKIVNGKSEEPIHLSELNFDAANVYYHLTYARKYFEDLNGDILPPNEQATIRVNVDFDYVKFRKFSKRPAYNLARTIPEGEIWFHQSKQEVRDILWLPGRYFPLNWWGAFRKTVGSIQSPVDTAKMMDVTYHEYTHLLLKDYLDINFNYPVSEGYANFFAAAISGDPIVSDMPEYCPPNFLFSQKKFSMDIDERMSYKPKFEEDPYTPFSARFLWAFYKEFQDPKDGALIILNSVQYFDGFPTLKKIPNALARSVEASPKLKEKDKQELLQSLNKLAQRWKISK